MTENEPYAHAEDRGKINHSILHPKKKYSKDYWSLLFPDHKMDFFSGIESLPTPKFL
jgi:hypothetical protein